MACLKEISNLEDSQTKDALITELKSKTDKNALSKLYSEFINFSEEEKHEKFNNVNNINNVFLKLLSN